jgi:maltose alpha-D-glucosyltransferase/alpha-amylase
MEMAHSLVLTLPGTPVLRCGDEIGMGEDLSLNERDSIRTPMQWSGARNAGFSSAPSDQLLLPVISGGEFGYEKVNVATQERDPNSFLNWIERMTRLRMKTAEFGTARCEWLDATDPAVLAHCCIGERCTVFAVHNLSARELDVTVTTDRKPAHLFDILQNREHQAPGDGPLRFHLKPYAYLWLREGEDPDI